MNLFRRVLEWRASRKADREAIAREREEALRAGDEPAQSMSETVMSAAAKFPPQP
jgi:hypothetical protein